ncbi:MAG: ATP-dependent zinc metalloprotease FtsH [Eubacteriales bacterium]|nr:ATP-dependent zinc metalloprotease FtsH [Clostridiales bacterium]MDY3286983.1 ATP-dependent zinc metalloprotease FtsH [Eubacteriales bacterium]MDY5014885.1 ATP-dependent zinc metalloprotease FtsH [Eubacteriales bacterium]
MKKSSFRGIGFYIIVLVFLIGTIAVLYNSNQPEEPAYSEVITLFKEGKVKKFVIDDNQMLMELRDGSQVSWTVPSWTLFFDDVGDTINSQREQGLIEWYDIRAAESISVWWSFLPYVVLIVLFGLFWFYMMNRAEGGGGGARGAMNFGKARAKLADDKNKKTFADVEGADEEKEELSELVDFLKAPKRFSDMGARIPKGVLLVGPPGTGKTLLARAVAGEAGVPFFSISGSDFVELYVGVGASRVRDLFDQAKKAAPAIIFIDEIDAVGRQRGAGLGGGHDEREQTLNQMLVEMDGFGANEGVIIIAATNRPDILDPALLRPGRFDRQVYVGVPDVKGREAILRLHARNKKFEKTIHLENIAKTTAGFTGADLENLLNEAALLAVRRKKPLIGDQELQEALVKVIMGPEKKSHVISEKDRRLTAYHEAGHAVVNHFLPTQDPVHQISIIPRGRAGGYNLNLPSADKSYVSKSEMLEDMVALLGGRVAEKLVLDDISTGASNDIQRSSDIARKMVTKYGMSDVLGPVTYGSEHDEVFLGRDFTATRNYSEEVAAEIDGEVRRIVGDAYTRCEEILRAHLDSLHAVAGFLLKHETMDGDVFRRIMAGDAVETIEADLEAQKEAEREKHEAILAEEARRKSDKKEDTVPPWIPPDNPSYDEFIKQHPEARDTVSAPDQPAAEEPHETQNPPSEDDKK